MLVEVMGMLFLNHLTMVVDSWWLSKVTARVTCSLLKADWGGWDNILGGTRMIWGGRGGGGKEGERERQRGGGVVERGRERMEQYEVREGIKMCVCPSINAGNSTMTNYINMILT